MSDQIPDTETPDQRPADTSTTYPIGLRSPNIPARQAPSAGYEELKRILEQDGLMARQPAYFTFKILTTLAMLALSLMILAVVDTLWLQLVNAAFLAFVFGQLGLIGHDVGHQAIFRSTYRNRLAGYGVSFLLGMVRSWWVDKHNRHHSNPNILSQDPDTNIPIMAFSEGQASTKRGFYRLTVSLQAYLFLPVLSIESLGLRLAGVQFLKRAGLKRNAGELLLMGVHFIVYLGLLFYFLSPWHVLLFVVTHQLLFGLYLGSVFAPNHKGMPVLEEDSPLDFIGRQVITSRNVDPHPVTDFLYGGLNYQIEHHLFPSMPRNNLKKAQVHVRRFCENYSIPYHQTSMVKSQKEILKSLHEISDSMRRATA